MGIQWREIKRGVMLVLLGWEVYSMNGWIGSKWSEMWPDAMQILQECNNDKHVVCSCQLMLNKYGINVSTENFSVKCLL